MGQKVHPRSVRLGIIQSWDSIWVAKDAKKIAAHVKEDHEIRVFLKKKLKAAAVSRIEIDRKSESVIIRIITGRSGIVVGRGGQGLDTLRKDLVKLIGRKDVQIDVLEVAKVDIDAQLVAESIATQLEKRVAYRRTMKQSIQRAMRSGAKGIKVMVSGRLGGAEIARTEWAKEGRIPLHVFRADIDYGFAEALTVFGLIGIKVWIFKGEVLPGSEALSNVKPKNANAGAEGQGGPQGGPGGRREGGRDGGRGRGRGGEGGGGGRGQQGQQGRGGGRGRSGPVREIQGPTAQADAGAESGPATSSESTPSGEE